MEKRAFETPLGEIWLRGEPEAFRPDHRPIVLVLMGALASDAHPFFQLSPVIPEAAVLFGRRPGDQCPPIGGSSIEDFGAAYGAAMDLAHPGRPFVIFGDSVGALTALAVRSPRLKGLVLVEPPLVTGRLWPLEESFRPRLTIASERGFIETVFGITETGVVNRDYRPLLARLSVPTRVFLGMTLLGERREAPHPPSLVDGPERDLLDRHPLVRLTFVEGMGHNPPPFLDSAIVRAIGEAANSARAIEPRHAGG